MIEILLPPLILVVLLVYIHAIFGLEIIRRGVIFTDLAIGQMAAVGLAISIGFLEGAYRLPLTLSFAVLGALIISYAQHRVGTIEAYIGMLYALGASSIMLLLASSPNGAELFQKLSAADIIFTPIEEIFTSALLYAVISAVMFLLYPRTGGAVREMLFFILLAVVVTSSVQSAGVLVVFALLIAPAFIAHEQKRFRELPLAWSMGILTSAAALITSYYIDLPTGYTIVFVNALAVIGFVFVRGKK